MTRGSDHEADFEDQQQPEGGHPVHQPRLSDFYGRLDRFESHIDRATEKIDDLSKRVAGLEKEVAGGPSFPMWAKGVVATIVLQTFGAVWWASQIDARVETMPMLQDRLTSAFQAMRNSDSAVSTIQSEHLRMRQELDGIQKRTIEGTDDRWRKRDDESRMAEFQRYLDSEIKRIEEKIATIDSKVVGRTDSGWHRSDHNNYAEMVEQRFKNVEKTLSNHESRNVERDGWWRQLWASGVVKEGRGSSGAK